MVEKGVSTLKVRDLLTITRTRWTSDISLTMTPPPEETRRSAAPARSAESNRASPAPRTITLKATSLAPALLERRPPPHTCPLAEILGHPRNKRLGVSLSFVHHVVELTICITINRYYVFPPSRGHFLVFRRPQMRREHHHPPFAWFARKEG